MANSLYDSGRDGFLKGEFNWSSDTFKVILLSSAYSANLSSHTTTANIGGTVAISDALSTLVPGSGIADANDITLSSIAGTTVTQFVIFHDSSKKLVAHINDSTNLPFTPSGGNVTLQWDIGVNKIFKL